MLCINELIDYFLQPYGVAKQWIKMDVRPEQKTNQVNPPQPWLNRLYRCAKRWIKMES